MRQRSVGSHGIRSWHDRLRIAAAKARAVLLEAGAAKLGVAVSDLDARDGFVVHKGSDKKVAFGDLIAAAAALPLPEQPALRPEAERRIGKSFPRIDIPAKTDGSAIFGVDVKLEGMLHGAARLAPVWCADVATINEASVSKMSGRRYCVKSAARCGCRGAGRGGRPEGRRCVEISFTAD